MAPPCGYGLGAARRAAGSTSTPRMKSPATTVASMRRTSRTRAPTATGPAVTAANECRLALEAPRGLDAPAYTDAGSLLRAHRRQRFVLWQRAAVPRTLRRPGRMKPKRHFWYPTGNYIDRLVEYHCDLCGTVRLPRGTKLPEHTDDSISPVGGTGGQSGEASSASLPSSRKMRYQPPAGTHTDGSSASIERPRADPEDGA